MATKTSEEISHQATVSDDIDDIDDPRFDGLPLVRFFPEGDGYLFIKELGKGSFGTACLVSSMKDNKLYVRKEDIDLQPLNPISVPTEFIHARMLRELPGVAKLHRWYRYQMPLKDPAQFHVSYWEFYNAGDLGHYGQQWHDTQSHLPERWAVRFLAQMIRTIIDVHRKGIVHRDIYARNWFINRASADAAPTIMLGDFGSSFMKPHATDAQGLVIWNEAMILEIETMLRLVIDYLLYAAVPTTDPLIQYTGRTLTSLAVRSRSYTPDLDDQLRFIAARLDAHETETPDPATDPIMPGIQESFDADLTDLKCWGWARVSHLFSGNIKVLAFEFPMSLIETRIVKEGWDFN